VTDLKVYFKIASSTENVCLTLIYFKMHKIPTMIGKTVTLALAMTIAVSSILVAAAAQSAYADSIKIQNNNHAGQGSKGSTITQNNQEACTNDVYSTRGSTVDQSNSCIVDQNQGL
jgi:hypothetical protein